ncbi:MAG: hypothetical protein J0L74_13600 [Burkholderiales bacterium]|nr:hypothetical protein [Burkholderiales bacterium]
MSFILDALRKSDAERQRAVTPGLSDVRYAARQSRRNVWLPILVVVLAANAVFLAVQWLGRDEVPVAPPTAVAPEVAGAGAGARGDVAGAGHGHGHRLRAPKIRGFPRHMQGSRRIIAAARAMFAPPLPFATP